jgi:hypothetical protein
MSCDVPCSHADCDILNIILPIVGGVESVICIPNIRFHRFFFFFIPFFSYQIMFSTFFLLKMNYEK